MGLRKISGPGGDGKRCGGWDLQPHLPPRALIFFSGATSTALLSPYIPTSLVGKCLILTVQFGSQSELLQEPRPVLEVQGRIMIMTTVNIHCFLKLS